ncbi:MAG: hypothetical protein ACFFCD_09530 [Promethearchaeota archaeon]
MGIQHEDEPDLQRKLVKILNKQGFHFEKVSQICDLVDKVRKICVEVKPSSLAPAQILYGIARANFRDVSYIGLANSFEIRFYIVPQFEKVLEFAKEIDPYLFKPPSAVVEHKWHEKAFELLGSHDVLYCYKGVLDFDEKNRDIFIDVENLEYFKELFEKYRINPSDFIAFIVGVYEQGQEISVNNEGKILNKNTLEPFQNKEGLQSTIYKPIRDYRDRTLIEATRVRSEDLTNILHQMDRLEPIWSRRNLGRFFTRNEPSKAIVSVVNDLDPDFIIEPYVGGGSLIEGLVKDYKGVGNDINVGFIRALEGKYKGYDWKFTAEDTITTLSSELFEKWRVPDEGQVLFLTNPPFGTVATNILVSKKHEIREHKKSRKIPIYYGTVGDKYGKGDACIPAIGKLIDMIKSRGNGYLAFFSPAGVFCWRARYMKLLDALLKDFEFLEGHIFGGVHFNGATSKKPIAFTVWKLKSDRNMTPEDLTFNYLGKDVRLKEMLLLKDGWKYNERIDGDEIGAPRNDTFNNPVPKTIKIRLRNAGSQMIPRNVKIDLNLPIPSELVYGLWSTTVGRKAQIIDFPHYPAYIDNAYTHLPDFSMVETMEILAYSVLRNLIFELENEYCEGKIGFIGAMRVFKFGGQRLTNGAQNLLDTYGYCPIGNKTIKEVFEELRQEPNINKLPVSDYRAAIREEVATRLEITGYWEYIPIPRKYNK